MQQHDGQWVIAIVQANLFPVSAADVEHKELVTQMAYSSVDNYIVTMTPTGLAETLAAPQM